MARVVATPSIVHAAGMIPKEIAEYIGRVNTGTESVSMAYMRSPTGWTEPGQRPEFDEVSYVVRGLLCAELEDGTVLHVRQGQALMAEAGQWIRYSTPQEDGAEYLAVCIPAFSPDTVHRDPA